MELRQAVAGFVDREYRASAHRPEQRDVSEQYGHRRAGLGQTTYARHGWQVKLCGLNKNIQNIFVITKLTLVFDVLDSREEAVRSFN